MEISLFDAFTRQVSATGFSRRQALRALGIALLAESPSEIAARFGLAEETAAAPRAKKPKSRKHPDQHEPGKPRANARLDGVQSEGKGRGRGKGKGKPHHKPPPPDPVCSTGKPRCPDGSCVPVGECCPGSRRCGDGFCVKEDQCCPGQKSCPDGSCVTNDACCSGDVQCPDGTCIPYFACCPGQKLCDDLSCVALGECCPDERMCIGEDDVCVSQGECCPWQRKCANGSCIPEDDCCPDAIPPLCNECEEEVCDSGVLVCRPKATCQTCPEGWVACPLGPGSPFCCEEDHYIFSETYGHYFCAGLSNGGQGVWCDWF